MAVVLLLLAALAGPALAQSGWSSLRDASVSPRLGRPSTTIRFGVTFRDRQDRPPAAVRVLIDGVPRAMDPGTAAGSDHGSPYVFATRLATGGHRIRFDATDADGRRLSVDGGWVWIKSTGGGTNPTSGSGTGPEGGTPGTPDAGGGGTSPEPTGAPSGGSTTPAPTKGGSHDAADKGTGGRSGHPPADSHDQTPGRAGSGPTVKGPARPDPVVADPTTGPTFAAVVPPPGSRAEGPTDDAPGIPTSEAGPVRRTPPGSGGGESAPSGLEQLGLGGGGPFDQVFRAYPVLITTSGTAVVWAAFVIFGKRRRDGEPPAPDEVLAVHAATGLAPLPAADLVPPVAQRQLPPGVEPDEADLPRWRRPSLLQARKADPLRMVSTAVSLSFGDVAVGASGPGEGERRRIRYRLVRLLDVPDEATGRELAVLDAGDEVQIVEEYGIYRLVLCPDGTRGWLHKMVIGELVGEDLTMDGVPDGLDEDVLTAFLAARRQTA